MATAHEIYVAVQSGLAKKGVPSGQKDAVYQLNLSGDDGGHFYIRIREEKAEVAEGNAEDADCTLNISASDFSKMMDGSLNGTTAFMMGKLKIEGNLGLAMKLESLLKSLQA
ncbi:MAG: SCP2 sterol-binding domain-containing protein [Alicyclobacillaceae bacterium]|uniref:SCP2 sterol-binding domain-containing protein n=1 Tax=Alicyclobacillus sp. SP_1 TaxID=2942475 RepID=UPI0021581D71|nr:SCP2 sterol-binding domain-containing protein [Alicyclobacillus sp. SP_1]MCY0887777.1 SCP2 sterol-binding domain-containing protein [Alicyclobacillaceae bacterium]MCY0896195.1 SCP2 sterol-binding domain-containing protein [Alicyclobacillaceae bacterium]